MTSHSRGHLKAYGFFAFNGYLELYKSIRIAENYEVPIFLPFSPRLLLGSTLEVNDSDWWWKKICISHSQLSDLHFRSEMRSPLSTILHIKNILTISTKTFGTNIDKSMSMHIMSSVFYHWFVTRNMYVCLHYCVLSWVGI